MAELRENMSGENVTETTERPIERTMAAEPSAEPIRPADAMAGPTDAKGSTYSWISQGTGNNAANANTGAVNNPWGRSEYWKAPGTLNGNENAQSGSQNRYGTENVQSGYGSQNSLGAQNMQNSYGTQRSFGAQNVQNGYGAQSGYGTPNANMYGNRNSGSEPAGAASQTENAGNAYARKAYNYNAQANEGQAASQAADSFRKTVPGPGGFPPKNNDRKARKAMNQSESKPSGLRRWASVVAMALVFGLVAGTVMTGVNTIGNHMMGSTTAESAAAPEKTAVPAAPIPQTETKAIPTAAVPGGTVADVARDVMPSLVTISTMSVQEMRNFFGGTQQYTVEGAGSGVIIGENDKELLIATNDHVVAGATEVSVGFIDESVIEAQIKGTDDENDLAIVSVKLEDIPEETKAQIRVATIGDSDALVLGEQVVAIGNALGIGQSVTSGYVSGLNRELRLSDGSKTIVSDGLIQTDAAINSGNSGGALLNMKGELIGINEAKSSGSSSGASVDNVGYAIPMAKAEPILRELMNEETREIIAEDEQGYLGVTCADVTADYSEIYSMPEGVCITSVVEGGPAAEAGIRKGDVLVSFNGKSVKTYENLKKKLQYYRSGESVEIVVMRADDGEYKEITVTVELGEKAVLESLQNEQE